MDYKNFNDYELLYLVSDNEDAMEIVLKKYEPIIFKMAHKYAFNFKQHRIDVEDLMQEGRIALVKAVESFSDCKDAVFYTFVILCVNRAMYKYCLRNSRANDEIINYAYSIDNESLDFLMDSFDSNENLLELFIEKEDNILKFKNTLNDEDAMIFDLKLSFFTYQEIAVLLGFTYSYVSSRLLVIRKSLKKYLLKLNFDL